MLRKMLSRKKVENGKEEPSTPASGSTSPCITTQVPAPLRPCLGNLMLLQYCICS